MDQEGCRCGTDSPGRQRLWAAALALVLVAIALPASAATAPERAAGSVTIVLHGQGRVTSEPPGAIDCPGDCSHTFSGSTSLTLRATPAGGWATATNGFCFETDLCTMSLNDATHGLEVSFRPRAKLQVWPNGDGAVTLSPTPADRNGEPDTKPCVPDPNLAENGCEYYYLPGTSVTAAAAPGPGTTFLGWSTHGCPGTGTCALPLDADSSTLVARFTPLEVSVILRGNETGSVVSEPPGIACPPTCTARFPFGSDVALVARPDPATPFLSWKFGCAVSATDPRRCVLTATNRPNWVGIALGEDDEIGEPTTLAVLFDVSRAGQGTVRGLELDCGDDCEHRYRFGTREELRASPADGWRFTSWDGACAKAASCTLYVGPVTSVAARFTENLAPALVSVQPSGKRAARKVRIRMSVRHAAQLRVRLRREGAKRVLADRRYSLRGGATTVVLPIPAAAKAGRFRLTIAVSDGAGGGRTYSRVVKVGA
jgi:hypothetical protein